MKNKIRGYIVLAIVLILLSVIAFAVPFAKTATLYIAYAFGAAAILFQIYVFKISFQADGDAKSKFYGFPIARVGVIYLGVQLIFSILEMCLSKILPFWGALIPNVLFLAAAVIGCIATDAIRDEIVRQDVQIKADVNNMRALQSLTATLVGMCSDETVKAQLQNLADAFKYSDPVSSDATKEMEKDLEVETKELQQAIIDSDMESAKTICNKLIAALAERNRVCKLNK